jgi:hypothetical protein
VSQFEFSITSSQGMDMKPGFLAAITLYPDVRKHPIVAEPFGCPCKFDPKDYTAWDCRILTKGEKFSSGETKNFEIVFMTPQAGQLFRTVPVFYLWEGQIIGEARAIAEISN